jgi:hypothetical protein
MDKEKDVGIDDLVQIKLRKTKGSETTAKKASPPEEPYEVKLPDQTSLYRNGRYVLEDFDKIVDPEGLVRKKSQTDHTDKDVPNVMAG